MRCISCESHTPRQVSLNICAHHALSFMAEERREGHRVGRVEEAQTYWRKRRWNWVRMRSLTNSFFGSSDFTAWFLKMTSSSHLFLIWKLLLLDPPPGES